MSGISLIQPTQQSRANSWARPPVTAPPAASDPAPASPVAGRTRRLQPGHPFRWLLRIQSVPPAHLELLQVAHLVLLQALIGAA